MGDVRVLATVPGAPAKAAVMVAEAGDALSFGAAPATRVGLFASYSSPSVLTVEGAAIVGAGVHVCG
ncbi:MAG: hypothetical protein R2715_00795 [Ilumatobacteraceae bacterium]